MNAAHGKFQVSVCQTQESLQEGLCTFDFLPACTWDYSVYGETRAERDQRQGLAQAMCRQCPVVKVCERFAHSLPSPEGIWGGQLFTDGARENTRCTVEINSPA
ncbi:WhiB family transcriptional regulator [Corynebacterium ulcerans]|uniref:WhiB family transcriptional regulator n=1 Tax=Corynebacterium ulcerans TaxID=65058 RepID=UPI000C765981|nr:WhiB family transcriptional regulator [Corynebacterium ulcerans]